MMNQPAGTDIVRLYLDGEGISQQELAQRAQVSQATVSRALARQPRRHTRAYWRLLRFIHEQSGVASPPPTVAAAVGSVWDGSREHEQALAALITASAELWPRMKGRE
jgi:hypothetical protein